MNGTVSVLAGNALPSTRDITYAPMIPRTDPTAAPISRFRLTSLTRTSKRTIPIPNSRPARAERGMNRAYGAKIRGARALPIAPPVTWTDMAVPRRSPPTRFTIAAAVGWKAALPRLPATRMAPSMNGVVARPARLRHATANRGPATARTFGRHRSARGPKTSWAIDPAICSAAAMTPAAASDNPSRGMNSGRSGA